MRMKRLIALLMTLAALTSCQKEESFPLTMDAAIKKVEKIIKQFSNRDWYASKDIIEPGTVLQYSAFGGHWDDPEMMHEYVSPDYRAWLVMIAEDPTLNSPDECLHLFIDADTGNYTEVWLKGQAIVEWGSTPFSRAMQANQGK